MAAEVGGSIPRWIQRLPELGVGLGFRRSLKGAILAHRDSIDLLELIAEHYMEPSPAQRRELASLRKIFPLIPHGLGLSLGSVNAPPRGYIDNLARVIEAVEPPWWSEHIAMTRAGPFDVGHLAPLPFTEQTVDVVCEHIRRVQQVIPVPLILENISYTHAWGATELTEAEFLTAILERSDCGLLLDLMNVHANSQNHGYDPYGFLDRLPLERVVQIHVVGGHREEGILVDSHSAPTPAAVWDLLQYVAERARVKGVIVEWDEQFPPFEVILQELSTARRIITGAQALDRGGVRRATG